MSSWHFWRDDPPPRETVVLACWSLTDKWIRVRTCRSGCCVSGGFGSMILPNFWMPTDDQTSPLEYQPRAADNGSQPPITCTCDGEYALDANCPVHGDPSFANVGREDAGL